MHGSVHVLLAGRNYRDSLGFTGDDHTVGSLETALHWGRFPIGVELGFSGGADYRDSYYGNYYQEVGSSAGEFYIGARVTGDLARGRVRPYVGTGITFLNIESDRIEAPYIYTEDDSTVGGYVHGGVMFNFGGRHVKFSAGVDVRWVYGADVVLFGEHIDADYLQVGPMFGIAF